MEFFLKSMETKEWLQQDRTLLGARGNNGEKLISLDYLHLPTPQEKKQNPLTKQHRLKQSVVRNRSSFHERRKGRRRAEGGGKSLTEGIPGRRLMQKSQRKAKGGKREENNVQSG